VFLHRHVQLSFRVIFSHSRWTKSSRSGHNLGQRKQERKDVPKRHGCPHHTRDGACGWQMSVIREFIERWMNKRGDGQFTPNHQSSDNDRDDAQVFHHEFLSKLHPGISQAAFLLIRNAATIIMRTLVCNR
jgi:hypothetical protein